MLMLDANDGDIYKSKFVKKLAEPGIQMEELFLKTNFSSALRNTTPMKSSSPLFKMLSTSGACWCLRLVVY